MAGGACSSPALAGLKGLRRRRCIGVASALVSESDSMLSVERSLTAIAAREGHVNSFLHLAPPADCRHSAEEAGRSSKDLRLRGVAVAVKDNLMVEGMPATAGSRILEGYSPPYTATAVKRLLNAGAVVLGKTNMDAFGMGSSTENSDFGVTRNPVAEGRVPGGSSGGSAAAVAAGFCDVALGSDTGGSIRQPASFCGVVGLKPSYGRVSRHGLLAYASSLDTVGPITRTVAEASLALEIMEGEDVYDATSAKGTKPIETAKLLNLDEMASQPLAHKRIGVIKETLGEGVDPAVQSAIGRAISHLESLGATVDEVSVPAFHLGLPAYYIIATSEASSNLSRYDGVRYGQRATDCDNIEEMYCRTRGEGFGSEVKRRIMMGTYALSAGYYDAFYRRAQCARTIIASELESLLNSNKFDCLVSPAAPTQAYKLGEKVDDPLSMYLGDLMTVNANLVGVPALVVPISDVELPVGLQIIGKMFDEQEILEVGHVFETTQ